MVMNEKEMEKFVVEMSYMILIYNEPKRKKKLRGP